jgi:RAD54-like protein 2
VKPHQIGGIRFLYDNIVESAARFESSLGFGCILAHAMGLGKTLQIVSFCDVFLRHTKGNLPIFTAFVVAKPHCNVSFNC